MHRDHDQLGFVDGWLPSDLGRNQRLDRILDIIDWSKIGQLVGKLHDAPDGRKAYPPLVMVKAMLLQQWYGLSDPRLEEALSDTLSFRRFVGLGFEDGTPDHSTISRFRNALGEHGLDEALFAEVLAQVEARGLVLKQGTLLDATLVEAQARKPAMDSDKDPVDKDANWTRKNGKSYYGYKAHVAVDQGSGLIRKAILTPAKIYESEVADLLICGDEKAVYADKAYEKKERRQDLKQRGIKDRIMHRSHKHQKQLPQWQQRRNFLISPIRSAVERVFGTLKRCYNYRKVRYTSLAANTVQMRLLLTAFNIRKAQVLMA